MESTEDQEAGVWSSKGLVTLPREHTEQWLRQQKIGSASGRWKTRTAGTSGQIGLRFNRRKRATHVVSPNVKTHSLSRKLVLPSKEGVGKPREIKPKAVKIGKKPRERKGMGYIEKMHLESFVKEHELDRQEIDSTLTYQENKKHLEDLAKAKGVSEEEIKGKEKVVEEDVSRHEEYLAQLKSELEQWGYQVTDPDVQ